MKISLLLVAILLMSKCLANEDNIIFPDDAGVLDITKPPYNAKGDGQTDCTAAIQQAFCDAAAGKGKIIYIPNGTYVVSDTIRWAGRQTRHVLQGQSRRQTIIKLIDRCPGYTDPSQPKEVIWTGEFPPPPQRFRNAIRNITVDIGKENYGAIGIRFNASNQGQMNCVTIRSSDSFGVIGLDMGYTSDVGPLLIKDVEIEGFEVGIYTARCTASQTMEMITLRNQRRYGWINDGQTMAVHRLLSINRVPVILNKRGSSLITLIDGDFQGEEEARQKPAIINEEGLYLANVKISGYSEAIAGKGKEVGLVISEYSSHKPLKLFEATPDNSLDVPVEETPDVPWDEPNSWANVAKYQPKEIWIDKDRKRYEAEPEDKSLKAKKITDWTDAIQQAIDSGATTVYFPTANYDVLGPLYLRGKVRRFIGMESTFGAGYAPEIVVEEGESPLVVIERFDWIYSGVTIWHRATQRTLILKAINFALALAENTRAFVEDGCFVFRMAKGSKLWLRQWNTEYTHENRSKIWRDMPWYNIEKHDERVKYHPGNLNDGGILWALGLKSEGDGALLTTINGGRSKVMGGLVYANKNSYPEKKAFIVKDSSLSLSIGEWVGRNQPFHIIAETRDGEERILKPGMAPYRGSGSLVVLANAYKGKNTNTATTIASAKSEIDPPGQGTGLLAQFFTNEFEDLIGEEVRGLEIQPDDPFLKGQKLWSVRLTGYLEPRVSGFHNFDLKNHGARLLIGDCLVADAWRNQSRYSWGRLYLEKGKRYPVIFEARGDERKRVGFGWRQPDISSKEPPLAQLYPAPDSRPRVAIIANKESIREDEGKITISLQREGDVDKELEVNLASEFDCQLSLVLRFAGRGTALPGRDYQPIPEIFRFAPGQKAMEFAITPIVEKRWEPDRVIELELAASVFYAAKGKPARILLVDANIPKPGDGTGINAIYFAKKDFSAPLASRVEPAIHFRWDAKAPAEGIDTKAGWSARFEGLLEPHFSDKYRLILRGASHYASFAMWLNDEKIIAVNGDRHSGWTDIALTARTRYKIKIEYAANNFYGQGISLLWYSDSQPLQIVPTTQLYPITPENAAAIAKEIAKRHDKIEQADIAEIQDLPDRPSALEDFDKGK